ncbi:MAG: hypothetical protein LQ344_005519 [Seirophora lacunosa]|nr:MAG: hypothetical protein LQ344_005519 [Seirophora lacunosa]
MFSTSELLPSTPQIVPAKALTESIISVLSSCLSDTYIIVTQPGVHAEDYWDRYAAPHLRRKVQGEDKAIRSAVSVTDVLLDVDTGAIVRSLEQGCGAALLKVDASTGSFTIADDPHPRVINLDFPALPAGHQERVDKLLEHDAFLASLLDLLPTSKYTVIYSTTATSSTSPPPSAAEPDTYEMDPGFSSSSQTHMELKRDLTIHGKRADGTSSGGNVTLVDGPLFERYAFLSPGIFMGLLIAIPLFLILYVGVSAVGSLQVSYAAFDREMGPAAQKKGQ